MKLRAFLVDDEPLALGRLGRMLEETGRVEVAGQASDPHDAAEVLARAGGDAVDVLFLDIHMPGMTGFDLLARLPFEPLVVFTTAHARYALKAFEVSSVDYLLKPIEPQQLDRAIAKLERIHGGREARPDLGALAAQLGEALAAARGAPAPPRYPERLPARLGDKVQFVELARVTHIFARDKLTFAAEGDREHCLDATIAELERRLDPERFVRIHRATIVNLAYVHELHAWFAGRMLLRLKDDRKTELAVARDRVAHLKQRLGL
jgi:two-component system LytT family response regulator